MNERVLLLLRHAQATPQNGTPTADYERGLSDFGKNEAEQMGLELQQRGMKPDYVLCSPAKRAMQTATIVAKSVKFPAKDINTHDKLYNAPENALLGRIRELPEKAKHVLLVGHNPALSSVVAYLSHHSIDMMPTGGLVCIKLPVDNWQDVTLHCGKFEWFEYPKNGK